jgi:hypothetical protein
MKVIRKPPPLPTSQPTIQLPEPACSIGPGRRLRRALAIGLLAAGAGCSPATETTPDGGGGGMVQATFTSLYGDYFATCKQCHAPNAPGKTSITETTLDFTSRTTALTTLHGMASGLTGNHTDCNGAPFLATTPGKSLLVAVLDQPTRQAIDLSPGHPTCDVDTISDETVKVGSAPSADFVTALKTWITSGAQDD